MLNKDSKTAKNAAVPVCPAFGGKLNKTTAILRSARSDLRNLTNFSTRAATASARSVWDTISWRLCPSVTLADSERPPNTIAPVAPSSSGREIIIVDSIGNKPRSESCHCSMVWNSTGHTAMYGTSSLVSVSSAAFLSL